MKPRSAKGPGVPLSRLAEITGGEIRGSCEGLISGINSLREAGPGEITFLVNPRYAPELNTTRAAAIIVGPPAPETSKPVLITANPYLAYARVAAFFAPPADHPRGVSPLARVGEECQMGQDITVYPFVYIGDRVALEEGVCLYPGVYLGDEVRIGPGSIIYPNVSILSGTVIGARVIIHSGTVIGSDGYGFARDGERHVKIPQIGTVRIDDDCEIGANNTIDRAALGQTWIQSGVKTDNLVQIAHNVVVGENSLLIAQVGISGSATIESVTGKTFTTPKIPKDGSYTFYLGKYDLNAKTIGPSTAQNITICFESGTTNPAIEVTLVKTSGMKKYVIDNDGRITNAANGLPPPVCPNGYSYSTLIQGTDIGADAKFLIIRVLYASTRLLFSSDIADLPLQGRTVSSEAKSSTSTGVSKKVVLFQSYPQIPGEFFTTSF